MMRLISLLAICASLEVVVVEAQGCTVCKGGEAISKPEQEISLPEGSGSPIAINDCATLDRVAAFVGAESEECVGIQTLGELCGCPSEPSAPSPPTSQCRLCPSGSQFRNSSQILATGLSVQNMSSNGESLLLQLTNFSQMTEPTCGVLNEFVAASNISADDCMDAQLFVDTCGGCSAIDRPEPPEQDEGQQVEMCTMCLDGQPVAWPDKVIENFVTPLPSCGALEQAASSVPLDSGDCNSLRGMGKACGCNMPENACSICGDREMTLPHAMYAWGKQGSVTGTTVDDDQFGDSRDWEFSCNVLDSVLALRTEQGAEMCLVFELRGASCGCPDRRDTIAVVLKRGGAALSLIGSLFIVWDVLRDRNKYSATHHQLVLGISVFDIISSVANLLGPIPLPEYSGTPGAVGNMDTCLALGFFTQLGQTASYFNLGLSLYFWLVICRRWKESTFRRIRYPAYSALVAIGLVLAFTGLRYYEFGFHVCSVLPPPVELSWYPAAIFFIIPLSIVLAGTTVLTVLVLLEVRRREAAVARFRSSRWVGDNQRNLTAKVFWKSVWYLCGFYSTYPILFTVFFLDLTDRNMWVIFLSSALGPSQGFWNFCVYIYTYRRSSAKGSSEFTTTSGNTPIQRQSRGSCIGFPERPRQKRDSSRSLNEEATLCGADTMSNSGLCSTDVMSELKKRQEQERPTAVAPVQSHHEDHAESDAGATNDPESDSQELDDLDDVESFEGCHAYTVHYH